MTYVVPEIARRLRTLLDDAATLQETCTALIAAPRLSPGQRLTANAGFASWRRDAAALVALVGRRGIVEYRGRSVPLVVIELELALLADELAASDARDAANAGRAAD